MTAAEGSDQTMVNQARTSPKHQLLQGVGEGPHCGSGRAW